MKKAKKGYKILISFIILVLLGLIGYYLFIMYRNIDIKNESKYKAERTNLSTNYEENVENSIEKKENIPDMIEKVSKSVVGISKLSSAGGSILSNLPSDDLGLGTGIIISENGYILSNNHVTGDKYSSCFVTIEQNTYKGTVVWNEEDLDLAIVKISANNLETVNFGDSKDLRVGQEVFAIGNPIGYEFRKTVTSGIISAVNRTIRVEENDRTSYISDLIQTDATINPGNSGGPLINKKGEVIGINTVKITSADGIGFAIPINVIKPVVESFKKNSIFQEASLGIYAYDSEVAEYLNLKNKINKGVYVSQILTNGAASKSKLREGDLITNIDGNKLKTINDLREYIYSKNPEDTVTLEILRREKINYIDIVLKKK